MTQAIPAAVARGTQAFIILLCLLAAASCSDQASALAAAEDEEEHHGSHQWTAFEDGVGLFIDYAPPAQGKKARFLTHFTDLATGAPVEGVEVVIEVGSNGQVQESIRAAIDETPGFAAVEGVLSAGEREAYVQLTGAREVRFGPFPLRVHDSAAAADEEAHALEEQDDGEVISFSVEQQWTARMLARVIERRDLAQRVAVAGEFVTPPHAQAVLAAPFAGLLLPPPNGELPRLGQTVEEGQVLAVLEVPLTTGDLTAMRANSFAWHEHEHELLLREFDLDAQEVTARQDLELAKTEIHFASQQLERVEGLFQRELATASERERAQQALSDAELHQESAERLLATLAEIRIGLERLRADHAGGGPTTAGMRVELQAPIAGVMSSSLPAQGSFVDAGQELATVVDPAELWLNVHVPEVHAGHDFNASGALLRLASAGDEHWDLGTELGGQLIYRAPQLDPHSRTLPLSYAIDVVAPDAPNFAAGMFADVLLATDAVEQVVAVPAESVIQQDGLSVAFVQLAGESFEKRVLELGVRDGDWIEVRRGLAAGERVVTSGAYLVRLAASAPDSFGHGHVH